MEEKTYKFGKGSTREMVSIWLDEEVPDSEIVERLLEKGLSKKNASRKLWNVKKIKKGE